MITKTIDYQDGSRQLEGYLAYHETDQPKPAVLVAHDWSGRREFANKAAERIADMAMWVLRWICMAKASLERTVMLKKMVL